MSLSPVSLVNPYSANDGTAEPADDEDPTGLEEVRSLTNSFKFDAFSHFAEHVAGDTWSLQTLERLKARWASWYEGGAAGSMLTSVGTLATATFSGGQSVTCGFTSSPRVVHGGDFQLPPPTVLMQPELNRKGVPLSPSVEQVTPRPSPSMQLPLSATQAPIFVGSVLHPQI
ncbi:hypothetical protein Salat_0834200 [Sesamum alatum]|uniref:Uncharacterized protein n=1 Tax=Sesamum alatum TaxID=300844 RepID=A0AAE1YI44_9LAMI|nr:hypothetical protein Salat_0834200 [Sesamum alatum]